MEYLKEMQTGEHERLVLAKGSFGSTKPHRQSNYSVAFVTHSGTTTKIETPDRALAEREYERLKNFSEYAEKLREEPGDKHYYKIGVFNIYHEADRLHDQLVRVLKKEFKLKEIAWMIDSLGHALKSVDELEREKVEE